MKRADIYIISLVILASALLTLISRVGAGSEGGVPSVEIYIGGSFIEAIPLPYEPEEHKIEADGGTNILLMDADGIVMLYADCPGGDCIRRGRITYAGEVIACLPHRLTVRLSGTSRDGGVDAVAG